MVAIRSLCALTVVGFALGGAGTAVAQDTPRWSEIDCAQSRLSTPPGLQCKATQNYAGGDRSTGSAGGTFRRWLASGRMNGAGVFYYLAEATSLGASMMEGSSLQKDIRNEMKDSNMIHEFSAMGNRGGADYMTFMTGAGNACVGIRRYGPSQGAGYQWILYGVSCDPRGRPVTDAQIDGFIAGASYRGS
ncbi:MAG: hypothetical protein Q7U75_01520 [Desulfobacterales bacterium]|nr:hypothetical protein [Desulfobacterales bacterium]